MSLHSSATCNRAPAAFFCFYVAGLLLIFPACAEREPGTEAMTGQELYMRYCSSCHGEQGRGDGPVAEFLTPRPTALSTLAQRYDGRYPIGEVMEAIDGTRTIRAHGDSAMPVWGEVFEAELQDTHYRRQTALHRMRAIAEYIQTLQQ